MQRTLAIAVSATLAACGTATDDRPTTLENVTSSILAPNCANAQCHSAFRQVRGYAFDSVEHAKTTIELNGLVAPSDPDASLLYLVLISPGGEGQTPRMPYDQPMPDADIQLIKRWIAEGADGIAP
jgi:hypothetical protein